MHNSFHRKLAVLGISLIAALITSALAQSPVSEREKPKLKDFGSSLKRLKWDPETNTAVRTEPKKRKTTDEDDVVRVETTLVVSDVLVLDKEWRPVLGLMRDDFIVTEDGKPQEVGAFALGDDAKIGRSIVLIIDYSGSQLPFIETSVKAAKTLIDKLSPRDSMAIVTDDVELLVDFTRDKQLLKEKLDSLEKKATKGGPTSRRKFGRSKQYSALMATLNEAFDHEDQRPVIVFQTDGDELSLLRNAIRDVPITPVFTPDQQKQAQKYQQYLQKYYKDNVTEFSLQDVYKAAENSRATIYTIIPGYRLTGLSPDKQVEKFKANRERTLSVWDIKPEARARAEEDFRRLSAENLKQMIDRAVNVQLALAGVAKITGGWHDFLEDPSQADTIYSLIFSDINRRYVVGYYPTNKERDGKRRKVNVELRGHPEYVVWGRKSYYAPEPEE
ncbi:MAG: VWA domain-containing protein [Pyrinomonadaceae bacterium]